MGVHQGLSLSKSRPYHGQIIRQRIEISQKHQPKFSRLTWVNIQGLRDSSVFPGSCLAHRNKSSNN